MKSQALASNHFLSGKRIAVVGGGLAGLSFALAFRKLFPSYAPSTSLPQITIYERGLQERTTSRGGYSLGIRSDAPTSGLHALQKLDLIQETVKAATLVTDENSPTGFSLWDHNMDIIARFTRPMVPDLPASHIRITRDNICNVLTDAAIERGCDIVWNSKCTTLTREPDSGNLALEFADGSSAECDVLIVADGASSKIRSQLRPTDGNVFRGVTVMLGTARFGDGQPLGKQWGIVKSLQKGGCFVAPTGPSSVTWSLCRASDSPRQPRRQPLPALEAATLKKEALAASGDFGPVLRSFIEATDVSEIGLFNAQDKEPFAHTDEAFGNVVFIGDANHAVSPFAGNGANMALCDGWDLAEQLCKASSLREAVKQYDELSVPRSTSTWKQSHWNISVLMTAGWRLALLKAFLRIINFLFLKRKIKAGAGENVGA